MKSKSDKVKNGVDPASKVIKKKNKGSKPSAIAVDTVETAVKIQSESDQIVTKIVKNKKTKKNTEEGEEIPTVKGTKDTSKVSKKKSKAVNPPAIAADADEPVELQSESAKIKTKTSKSKKTKNNTEVTVESPAKKSAKSKSKVIKKKSKAVNQPAITEDAAETVELQSESDKIKTKTAGSNKTKNDNEKAEESTAKEGAKKPKGKEYTIFIANLPTTITKKQLKALFSKYGVIETARMRTNDGRVIYHKRDLKNILSLNGYVRFSSKEEMEKACEMNGQLVAGNRIRVCPQGKKQIGDARSTVFVGNIKLGTTENELYDFFCKAGPIEFIRLISQKHFAYVCFKKGVSIKKVLKLDQTLLNNRPLRIQLVDKDRTNVKLNKKGNLVSRRKQLNKPKVKNDVADQGNKSNGAKANDVFHGELSEAKKKKKSVGVAVKRKKILAGKLMSAMKVK